MEKILFAFLFTLAACTNAGITLEKDISPAKEGPVTEPPFTFNYDVQKERCRELFQAQQQQPSLLASNKLVGYIADSLLPCWYGTSWDFNGTTQQPGTGKIACGYFVTTVLRDAGFSIDRVKMAQCASQQLVNATCTDISIYRNKPLDHFVNEIKKSGYGLYIVGLDYHTGFILNDDKEVYFIHSGVYPPKCALKEKALESRTLNNSTYRVIGKIKL